MEADEGHNEAAQVLREEVKETETGGILARVNIKQRTDLGRLHCRREEQIGDYSSTMTVQQQQR